MVRTLKITIPDEFADELAKQYEQSVYEYEPEVTDDDLGKQMIWLLRNSYPRAFNDAEKRVESRRGV